jgi:hypothetical protein
VVIDVASSDTGEGTVSPAQLTFTTGDWETPQTVTLTGVNDMAADGSQPYTVTLTMNQTLTLDPVYDAIDPQDVSAVNLEFDGDFFLTTPCRVLDTRLAGPPLAHGVSRTVTFHGVCGVPATARAVAVTAVVVDPTAAGSLALFPSDFPRPGVDLVSFPLGKTLAGNAIVLLATDGTGTLDASIFFSVLGSAHLAIDLAGYFE